MVLECLGASPFTSSESEKNFLNHAEVGEISSLTNLSRKDIYYFWMMRPEKLSIDL